MRPARIIAVGAFAGFAASASLARATTPTPGHDFFLSFYGDSGLEVFSDERVFALFAAFNALGYDEAPVARQTPIPRPAYGALRAQVRGQTVMSNGLQKRFQEFLDAHPLSKESYVSYVMTLGPQPQFASPGSNGKLAGLEALLAAHEQEAHVAQVYASIAAPLREALKNSLAALEPSCREADKWLPASTRAASLELNPLEAPTAAGVATVAGQQSGVAGLPELSSRSPDLSAAVWAYAAGRVSLSLNGATESGLNELLGRIRRRDLPAGSLTTKSYVAESYGAAVAAQVFPQRRQAILTSADAQGLWLAEDFSRMLSDVRGRPSVEEALGPRLAALDLKKVAPPSPAPGL